MLRQKPFIVEFTGTPEAGKTTTIHIIYELLTSLGYKVKLYPESAESTPHFFPKKSIEANIWQMSIDEQVEYLKSIAVAGCNQNIDMPKRFVDWIQWKLGNKISNDLIKLLKPSLSVDCG